MSQTPPESRRSTSGLQIHSPDPDRTQPGAACQHAAWTSGATSSRLCWVVYRRTIVPPKPTIGLFDPAGVTFGIAGFRAHHHGRQFRAERLQLRGLSGELPRDCNVAFVVLGNPIAKADRAD